MGEDACRSEGLRPSILHARVTGGSLFRVQILVRDSGKQTRKFSFIALKLSRTIFRLLPLLSLVALFLVAFHNFSSNVTSALTSGEPGITNVIPYLYNPTGWGIIYLNFSSAELGLSMPGVMLGNLSTPGVYIPNDQSNFNYRLAGPFVVNTTIDGWEVYGFTFIALPTYANGTVVNYTYKMQKTLIIAYKGGQVIALLYYKSLAPVPLLLNEYWSHVHKGTDGLDFAIWPSDFNPYSTSSPGLVTQAYYLHGNTSVYINGSYVGQLNSFGLWQVLPVGPILMVNKLGGWNVSIVIMDNMSSTPQIQLVTNGFFINSTKVDNSYFNIQHGAITLYSGQAAQYVYAIGLNANPPDYQEVNSVLPDLIGLAKASSTPTTTETTTFVSATTSTETVTQTVTATHTSTVTTTVTQAYTVTYYGPLGVPPYVLLVGLIVVVMVAVLVLLKR